MSDIFREVDEEVRRDKALEFWSKHGTKFLLLAALIVAGVGGWRVYDNYMFKERAALSARFEAALAEIAADPAKPEAQGQLADLAKRNAGTYSALARFRLAGERARAAKDEAGAKDAASAFDTLAGDTSLPAGWRDLARLRAGFALIDFAAFEEVEKRLQPLVAPENAFRHSAREGIALAAYRAGRSDKALDALQAIILDVEAPAGLRQRAETLLAVVRSGAKP